MQGLMTRSGAVPQSSDRWPTGLVSDFSGRASNRALAGLSCSIYALFPEQGDAYLAM